MTEEKRNKRDRRSRPAAEGASEASGGERASEATEAAGTPDITNRGVPISKSSGSHLLANNYRGYYEIPFGPDSPASRNTFSGGVDAITVSCFGEIENGESIFAWLDSAKAMAADSDNGRYIDEDEPELIHRRSGGSAAGIGMAYGLEFGPIVIMMSKREDTKTSNFPTLQIQAMGTACMMHGLDGVWEYAKRFCELIGFTISGTRVNRLDICADVAGVDMASFYDLFQCRAFVTKARAFDLKLKGGKELRCETMYFGSRDSGILGRIYDKLTEARRDEAKFLWMVAHRWGGVEPACATRVEFEMSGAKLNELFSLTTLEQVCGAIGDIVEYCCMKWLRFTDERNDQKHYELMQLAGVWRQVVDAFYSWSGDPSGHVKRKEKLIPETKRQISNWVGTLANIFAKKGWRPANRAAMMQACVSMMSRHFDDWARLVDERRAEFERKFGDHFEDPGNELQFPIQYIGEASRNARNFYNPPESPEKPEDVIGGLLW